MKSLFVLTVVMIMHQVHCQAGQAVSVRQTTDKECTDCVNFFGDLQNRVKSPQTAAQIEQLLNQMVCANLGPLQDVCKNLVDEFVPMYLQQLSQMIEPKQVCGVLGMCTQDMLKMKELFISKLSGAEECSVCKSIVAEARTFVRNPTFQNEIKTLLEGNVCSLFGQAAAECKTLVETYAPMVFQVLANELDGTVVCEALDMCTQSSVHMSRLGLASKPAQLVTKKNMNENNNECTVCKLIVSYVKQQLENNTTKEEIKDLLEDLCGYLPSEMKGTCTTLVDQYFDLIVSLIDQEMDPQAVCTAIGFCTGRVKVALKVNQPVGCIICEFVLNETRKYISANSTRPEVEHALENICAQFPETIKDECKAFVDAYGATVINLLVNEIQPEKICTYIKLCKKSTVLRFTPKKQEASEICVLCEFAMRELDKLISNNATEIQIMNALEQVCHLLPSTISEECDDFIQTYTPAIVQLITQELDPKFVCTALGVCGSSEKSLALKTVKPVKKDNEPCKVCKAVLGIADELLKENSTIEETEKVLENICSHLPDAMKQQCDVFVKEYTALVVLEIATNLDAEKVCEAIKLCPKPTTAPEKHLLGQEKCTYGPAYWCDSMENAVQCNTVEHCKKHVWN